MVWLPVWVLLAAARFCRGQEAALYRVSGKKALGTGVPNWLGMNTLVLLAHTPSMAPAGGFRV